MQITIGTKTYNFDAAPGFVRHRINLIIRRWSNNLDNAQGYAKHAANDLGRRFGTLG